MKGKSSMSMPIPLQILRPSQGRGAGDGDRASKRELQIVDPKSPISASRFKLPDGWIVEERPRINSPNPGRVDRYYYEPGTGQMFRSLVGVQKYLTEQPRYKKRQSSNNISPQKKVCKQMQIVSQIPTPTLTPTPTPTPTLTPNPTPAHTSRSTSSFKLPNGWIIEEKPRRNAKYPGIVDKYYIEPGTGCRFRSLRAVERYLTEPGESAATMALESGNQLTKRNISPENNSLEIILKERTDSKRTKAAPKTLELGNPSTPSKTSGSRSKQKCPIVVQEPVTDFTSPPSKIKWVLNSSRGNRWSPLIRGSLVPASEQQKWSRQFVLSIQNMF